MTWESSRSLRDVVNDRAHTREDLTNLQVVVFSENVGWNCGSEVVPKLILVGAFDALLASVIAPAHLYPPILNIHHPLRVSITEVAFVGQPEVDLGLVQGVRDLIREDAR